MAEIFSLDSLTDMAMALRATLPRQQWQRAQLESAAVNRKPYIDMEMVV